MACGLLSPLQMHTELPICQRLPRPWAFAGAQVLGLTSYSRWADGAALRRCAASDAAAAERLHAIALARLRGLAHVGLTERLPESVASLAASLGLRMDGPAWKVGARRAAPGCCGCKMAGTGGAVLPRAVWYLRASCLQCSQSACRWVRRRWPRGLGMVLERQRQQHHRGRAACSACVVEVREAVWQVAADAFAAAQNGTTVQPRGDDEYLLPLPLWRTYGQCVARARKCAALYHSYVKQHGVHLALGLSPLPCGRAPSATKHALSGVAVPVTVACSFEASVPEGYALLLQLCCRVLQMDKGERSACQVMQDVFAPQARDAPQGDLDARAVAERQAALQPGGARAHRARAPAAHPVRPGPHCDTQECDSMVHYACLLIQVYVKFVVGYLEHAAWQSDAQDTALPDCYSGRPRLHHKRTLRCAAS